MVSVREYKKEEISNEMIENELINNNESYLLTALLIKLYNDDKNNYVEKRYHINRRMIDSAYRTAYDNDIWFYDCKYISDIYDEFLEIYRKNQPLYEVMEEEVDRIKRADCGFYPFYNTDERRERTMELIYYPIECIRKALFINVVYRIYLDPSYNYCYINDSLVLYDWDNPNLYESYYDEYADFSVYDVDEYIFNNCVDEFYDLTESSDKLTEIHNQVKYMEDKYLYEIENNGLEYSFHEEALQLIELKENIDE